MKKSIILLSFVISTVAFAMTIEDERGKVSVNLPEGWKYEKNILGLPHVFLSPGEENRSSLSLTMTGLDKVALSPAELKKNQLRYQEGRKDWALKRGIEIKTFIPYREFKIEMIRVHEIGVEYTLEGKLLKELSYYAECSKSLVHLKGLGRKDSPEMKKLEEIVKSLRCL